MDWECGDRSQGTLSKMMVRLNKWKISTFCTDHWDVYPKEISSEKLVQSKSETVFIERNNGRQRHWLARFHRKSICVSRSRHMVDLIMSLFANFHVNGPREKIRELVW